MRIRVWYLLVWRTTLNWSSDALVSTSLPTSARPLSFSPPERKFTEAKPETVKRYSDVDSESDELERISKEPPLIRALEISGIILSRVIWPLSASVLTEGVADDWDSFWARSNGNRTNAEHLTEALELLGPVYVKFGQALASRPDVIPQSLAASMSTLQDNMHPFDSDAAKQIVVEELLQAPTLTVRDMESLLECLSDDPIAAASVGQVYKAKLGNQKVAVKVQRPGIRTVVERDATLLRTIATCVESIPALPFTKQGPKSKNRLVATELVDAVEEFMSRIFEELDYRNEAANAATFASLYSHRGGSSKQVKVVVPEIYPDLCTDNVLVMSWLDGTKLTNIDDDAATKAENLALVEKGIQCTLSQLLDTGVLHADPHGGNLLKIQTSKGPELGYLDFGLLSSVPQQVRDALVCAVAHLVFDRDVDQVATLFGELQLVPADVMEDPEERSALTDALNQTMNEVLEYPVAKNATSDATLVPKLRFDKLLDALVRLVPRFRFQLPPYFINNARALSTLEGIARSLDNNFNVLQVLYPYALNRLLCNPTDSQVVDDTLQRLIRSPESGRVDFHRIAKVLDDSSLLTGYRKGKVVRDVLRTSGGRRLARRIMREEAGHKLRFAGHVRRKTRIFRL